MYATQGSVLSPPASSSHYGWGNHDNMIEMTTFKAPNTQMSSNLSFNYGQNNNNFLPPMPIFPLTPLYSDADVRSVPTNNSSPMTFPIQQFNIFPNTNTNSFNNNNPTFDFFQNHQQTHTPPTKTGVLIDLSSVYSEEPSSYPSLPQTNQSSTHSNLNINNNTQNQSTLTAPSFPHIQKLNEEQHDSSPQRLTSSENKHGGLSAPEDPKMKRCQNCKYYYYPSENVANCCRYHPGVYKSPSSVAPLMMSSIGGLRWSCCREYDQAAPGCRVNKHVVDKQTEKILKSIDKLQRQEAIKRQLDNPNLESEMGAATHNVEGEKSRQVVTPKYPAKVTKQELKNDVKTGGTVIKHIVVAEDTLMGLSLRYGVPVESIKRANRLTRDSIYEFSTIDIPNPKRIPKEDELKGTVMSKANKEELAIKRMMRMVKCEESEAKFYLAECDYDVNKAIDMRREDLVWEKDAPKMRSAREEEKKASTGSGIMGRFASYVSPAERK